MGNKCTTTSQRKARTGPSRLTKGLGNKKAASLVRQTTRPGKGVISTAGKSATAAGTHVLMTRLNNNLIGVGVAVRGSAELPDDDEALDEALRQIFLRYLDGDPELRSLVKSALEPPA